MSPLDELTKLRRDKLEILRKRNTPAYAYSFKISHRSKEILESADALQSANETISVAGRLMSKRGHGKASFSHIKDFLGKIQVYFREDEVGEEAYALFDLLDVGDIVGVRGKVFKTKTGETTVKAEELVLLTKSLTPLPEKWHGLKDVETRFRRRYVDLIVNDFVRDTFVMRGKVLTAMRRFLDSKGFTEVETPILQPIYGGAFAKPFTTRHEALERRLYLRVSDELYLKRLIVGGFEKVYEIGKDFRNEGMDKLHSPEFTMMELYEAYSDYLDMMTLLEEMVCSILMEVKGSTVCEFDSQNIDFKPPWRRIGFFDSLKEKTGLDLLDMDEKSTRKACLQFGIEVGEKAGYGKMVDELFSSVIQPGLIQPTCVIDYPKDLSPLAKEKRGNPKVVERFELFAGGLELANSFSEQNDPTEQEKQFERQAALREKGDVEAQVMDRDFISALECGMPPTGGLGVGIDRLVMLFSNVGNIREAILFPPVRNEIEEEGSE
ncbi:MAG: lysine--tRNA ligase [Candidatus Eisenbacteria bacterium]|nr:lysine--tRNA ligase [Candidatus Eisenbacteria bacterium]